MNTSILSKWSLLPFLYLFSFTASIAQTNIGLYGDTEHLPFIYGVASGDPTPNKVMLWTAVDHAPNIGTYDIHWEVALDKEFRFTEQAGIATVDASTDWTLNLDIGNLNSYTTYYYRFWDATGNQSVIGRTRTAPVGDECQHFRFGSASCSSLYSGYFNAYQRLAERSDIDAVIHLGDYIYDFVDGDEEVRVPSPYPSVPSNLQEWRDRYKQYLLDPDFRAARQQHPWIVITDNHEVADDYNDPEPRQAFLEFVPTRLDDPTDLIKIYRSFQYGDMVEIIMVDVNTYRNQDAIPSGGMSMLGNTQHDWLIDKLQNSTAKWILIGQQKMVGGWNLIGLPDWFPGDGSVFDDNSWDGNDEARDRLFNEIAAMGRDNIMFLSGDLHMSFATDLSRNPFDGGVYDGDTGAGAVAVEFMSSGINRGNFDESGVDGVLLSTANGLSEAINTHHVYSEFESHGYGIVDIQDTEAVAELWFSDILAQEYNERFERGMVLLDGVNHWERSFRYLGLPPKTDIPTLNFADSDCMPYNGTEFSLACSEICMGEPLQIYNNLNNQNQALIQEYNWDFGDGTNSTLAQPMAHTYTQAGTYTINFSETLSANYLHQITLTSANCDDPFDAPDFFVEIIDPDNGLIYTVNYIDDTNTPVSFFPDLALEEGKLYEMRVLEYDTADPNDTCGTFKFTSADNGSIGNEDVSLILDISPKFPFTQSYSQTVTVLPSNHPDCIGDYHLPDCQPFSNSIFAFSCTDACTNDSIQLTNFLADKTTTYKQSFLWDFGNGQTSTQARPNPLQFTQAGTYSVQLTETLRQDVLTQVRVTSADCSDTFFTGDVDLFIEIDDPILGRIYTSNDIENEEPPVNFGVNIPMAQHRIYSINVIDDDQPQNNDFCGSTTFTSDAPNPVNGSGIALELTVIEQVVSTQTYAQTIVVQDCAACPPNYTDIYALIGSTEHTLAYATDGAIASTQTLLQGANMDYNSGTQICMDAGFEVVVGAVFHAYIEGCIQAMLREKVNEEKIRP